MRGSTMILNQKELNNQGGRLIQKRLSEPAAAYLEHGKFCFSQGRIPTGIVSSIFPIRNGLII